MAPPNRHIKSKQLPSLLKYLCNWSPSLHLCVNHPNQAIFLQQKHCNNYSLTQASWQGRRHWNSSGKVSSNKDYAVTQFFSSHKPTVWFFHDTDPMCTFFKVSVCMVSCPTLCDPVDCTLPGFSVHGILQARTLVWTSMTSTRESSRPRDQIHISYVSCIGRWVLYHWATREALCKVSNFTNDSTCKEWGALELVSKVPENRVFLSFLVIYDCSHKIKRFLLLGRKAMTNLDSVLKTRDITLLTKVCLVKVMVFPVVMYGYERWTIKKAECWRIDTFQTWCWRWLLIDPWTAKRSNQSILKKINPEYSLEGLVVKLKLQYFGHWCEKLTSWKRPWYWERLNSEKAAAEDKMVGWYHWLNGHEFEQTQVNSEGQGSLLCCSSCSCKESDTT